MNVKQIRRHAAVLAAAITAVLAILLALATVTSHADTSYDPETRTYTMTGGTYSEQIVLDADTATTINISGENKLTYEGPCITGDGSLTIIGSGTLDASRGFVQCGDLTMRDAKLKISYMPGLSAIGNITVENANIKAPFMTFGGGGPSRKCVFNNTRLNVTAMPGLQLLGDTVLTNCNFTAENSWLYSGADSITIEGGTYNISQEVRTPAIYFSNGKAKVNNAVIKTSSFCLVKDFEMTGTNFEIKTPGPDNSKTPAFSGDNAIISGCKINIDGGKSSAGITMNENLTIKDNTEMMIQGTDFGIFGFDVQIIHSSGKIQATGTEADAAVVAFRQENFSDEIVTPGTIVLDSVEVKEPAGAVIGKIMKHFAFSAQDKEVTAITDGKAPAMTVVLEAAHKWDAGKVTKQPTTSAEGVKTYTCTICGATRTEAIPKLTPQAPATGDDGTVFGKGASVAAAEAAILALPNDNDPAGTAFGLLQLKASKVTKNSVKLTWKAVPGATKYILFANKCGTGNKYKKLGEVTGTSYTATQAAGAAIQKGTYYKFMMIAANANGRVVSTSKTVHAATKGGKVGNHKKVTVKKAVIKKAKKLKKGKTLKLKAKAVPQAKKLKVRKHRGIKYESSNPRVAQVSGKGTVKGVGKGTCYIYAYAQNGTCAKVKVTVK